MDIKSRLWRLFSRFGGGGASGSGRREKRTSETFGLAKVLAGSGVKVEFWLDFDF